MMNNSVLLHYRKTSWGSKVMLENCHLSMQCDVRVSLRGLNYNAPAIFLLLFATCVNNFDSKTSAENKHCNK